MQGTDKQAFLFAELITVAFINLQLMTEKIIGDWKKGRFLPVYWLEGDESFFIDRIMDHAEHHILTEQEAGFNLSVFYGKDAAWADVMNACRRYPMFAERQVVLLKEAQQMKDIDKLEPYIEHPLSSTVFVIGYKDKKIDKRTRFYKTLSRHGEIITTKKMGDRALPAWTEDYLKAKGFSISQKALMLMIEHIGNDLSRITNEIGKMELNLKGRSNITEDDIEQFIGVSKDYNVFELQTALGHKDLAKAIRIINYFESNPKAAAIQQVLPLLYSFFSKVYMVFGINARDEGAVAETLGVPPFFVKDYIAAARKYELPGVRNALLLLHHYNLKSLGIGDPGSSDASLMKEMAVKMMNV
jgi:DNA polymerase-3 subunit delta